MIMIAGLLIVNDIYIYIYYTYIDIHTYIIIINYIHKYRFVPSPIHLGPIPRSSMVDIGGVAPELDVC